MLSCEVPHGVDPVDRERCRSAILAGKLRASQRRGGGFGGRIGVEAVRASARLKRISGTEFPVTIYQVHLALASYWFHRQHGNSAMKTPTPELDALVRRLDLLERQNRRLKLIGLAVLVAVGVCGALGAARPNDEPLKVTGLVVTDKDGKARVTVGVGRDGPAVILTDADGNARAVIGLDDAGPRVELKNEKGVKQLDLAVTRDGPVLTLADDRKKPRLGLRADAGGPGIVLQDSGGKVQVEVAANEKGAGIGLLAEDGSTRASLEFRDGNPGLFLREPSTEKAVAVICTKETAGVGLIDGGKTRVALQAEKDASGLTVHAPNQYTGSLGVTKDGPRLFFHDDKAQHRAGLVLQPTGSALVLLGDNGKPRILVAAPAGAGAVSLMDGDGKKRIELTVGPNGPAVELKDADGKVLPKLP